MTDSEGRFLAPFLTPGVYEVKVALSGFSPVDRTGIQVSLGQRVELSLPMQVQALTESVQVHGESPTIDMTSTTAGATLDAELLSRVPVGRRFSDALYLAPGVSSGGQVGQANPSIAGGSGLENSYVVDGVNITNGGYGALGSYSIVFGSLGQRDAVRLHPADAGEDRRLPGGVRSVLWRRRERGHEERDEQASRQPVRLSPARGSREQLRPGRRRPTAR